MNISQGGGSQGSFSERASAGASNMLDSAKRLLGVETQPRTWLDELEERCCGCCPSFTWQQRLFGCLLCFVIGLILEFGSFLRFTKLLMGNPTPFATCYTLGNVISIAGSCFLSGPSSQVKSMFHSTRAVCTVVYISTLCITLVLAFSTPFTGQGPLLVLCIIVQFCSLVWYILSYIPFARTLVWQMCGSCFGLGQESSSSVLPTSFGGAGGGSLV